MSSTGSGGAIYITGGGVTSGPTLNRLVLVGNLAAMYGGAIYASQVTGLKLNGVEIGGSNAASVGAVAFAQ